MARVMIIGVLPESLLNFRGALIKDLIAAGHTVHAVSAEADARTKSALARLGAIHHEVYFERTGTRLLADLTTLWQLFLLLRQVGPEHVLAYTIKPVLYGGLAARMAGVPRYNALITGLGYVFDEHVLARPLGRVVLALYRKALKKARIVFFQNPDDCRVFREHGLLAANSRAIVVDGSGVDIDFFRPAPFPSELSFLMIARLLRAKGVYEYVEAARRLRQEYPGVVCRLVGWIDPGPDAVRPAELEAWQREGVIEYLGRLQDVRPAIAQSSVYVLPSYREGVPRTVLEAMAMGRPVITTNAPGCKETVVLGENGYLIPPRNVGALVDAMRRYIESPELVELHGAQSRCLASTRFDVRVVNRRMLEEMGLAR